MNILIKTQKTWLGLKKLKNEFKQTFESDIKLDSKFLAQNCIGLQQYDTCNLK